MKNKPLFPACYLLKNIKIEMARSNKISPNREKEAIRHDQKPQISLTSFYQKLPDGTRSNRPPKKENKIINAAYPDRRACKTSPLL